jgi:multisubunit Na+/H+ antiporter MnhG subunit
MAARFGNVLYWTACIFSALWFVMGVFIALGHPYNFLTADLWLTLSLLFIMFVPPIGAYLIGLAIRYIVVGKF